MANKFDINCLDPVFLALHFLRRSVASGFIGLLLPFSLMTLTACGGQPTTASDQFDMRLQHIQTSPVPGGTGEVLPNAPDSAISGSLVGACVTDAGYCPLEAETAAGRNCLCRTSSFVYGGVTAVPSQYNMATNPEP